MRPILLLSSLLFFWATSLPAHTGNTGSASGPGRPPHRRPPPRPHPLEEEAPRVSITIQGAWRVISSNGIPSHETGAFPNRGNPNAISPQSHLFMVPLHPVATEEPTPKGQHPFGVAVNGVPFDPDTAGWWQDDPSSGWRMQAITGEMLGMDGNNAHVQPNGAYHYHALPTGLVDAYEEDTPVILGWAADGYPITAPWGHQEPMDPESPLIPLRSGYVLKEGSRPGGPDGPGGAHDGTYGADWIFEDAGDLDLLNGRFAALPGFPEGTYHYVISESWPFVPRFYRGTPHESFQRRGPHGTRRRPPPR